MSAPDLLPEIKEDLGICGTSEHDAWLERRIAGVWSRIENYTARALCVPPQSFTDDWSRIAVTNAQQPMPPALFWQPRTTVFLRYFPVVAIEAVELSGGGGDPLGVRFDPRSGKLFTLTGQGYGEDLSAALFGARITYRAGWDEIPGDLYEIVLGAVQQAWSMRASASAGSGVPAGSIVTGVTVADVGSLEVSPGGSAFVQSASKNSGGAADPILGPYLNTLQLYVDHRSLIGHAALPVTEAAPEPVP